MNINQLRPARDFAQQYGFKSVIYGAPGTAKTPLVNTAPRPVLLACEPGLLSMRGSNVPTWGGFTATHINEFFLWFFNSNETKNFDTLAVDSVSQMCEAYLLQAQKTNKHGLAAYGEMAKNVMDHLRPLYFTQHKHTYLICKQDNYEENGIAKVRPYFPGKQLPVEVPHLYDAILNLGTFNIPGVGPQKAFRCIGSLDAVARNRMGNLNEYEPPDFGAIVKKALA